MPAHNEPPCARPEPSLLASSLARFPVGIVVGDEPPARCAVIPVVVARCLALDGWEQSLAGFGSVPFGFPVGIWSGPFSVPGFDSGGEPGAVFGVAAFVVGWAVVEALIEDGAGA